MGEDYVYFFRSSTGMDRYQRKLTVAGLMIFGFLFFGTLIFHLAEGWSWIDSFYMSGITVTTVGYGDLAPTHAFTKTFSVFLALAGISVVFYSVGIFAQHYFELEEQRMSRIWESARSQGVHDAVSKGAEAVGKSVSHMAKHLNGLASQNRRSDVFVPIEHLQRMHFKRK